MKSITLPSLPLPMVSLPSVSPTLLRPQNGDFLTHLRQAVGEIDNPLKAADQGLQRLGGEGESGAIMKPLTLPSLSPSAVSLSTTALSPLRSHSSDFLTHLKQAVGEVDNLHKAADHDIQQLVGEGKGDLQETLIALEKADVSFRLMMQIRNKVLDAYQEISRMQV